MMLLDLSLWLWWFGAVRPNPKRSNLVRPENRTMGVAFERRILTIPPNEELHGERVRT